MCVCFSSCFFFEKKINFSKSKEKNREQEWREKKMESIMFARLNQL